MWIINAIGDFNEVCCAKPLYYLPDSKYSENNIKKLVNKLNGDLENKHIDCLDATSGFDYQYVSKYNSEAKALHKIAEI